jgi:hypothetical protein
VLSAYDWGTPTAGGYCFSGAGLDISNPKPGHFGAWQARVYDNGTQLFGGPTIAGGTFRPFPVPLSGCNVPSNAAAYSFNVTIVPQGPSGI